MHCTGSVGRFTEIIDRAELVLADVFSSVECQRRGINLAWISQHLRTRQAEWVLCVRLVQRIRNQRELARVYRGAEFGIELIARCCAVQSIAAGIEARNIDEVIQRIRLSAQLQAGFACAVTACQEGAADGWHRWAIGGKYLHDATGGIAVQTRKRAAQHFDALSRGKIESRRLSLPIGHGGGDAVGNQPYAAHTECRAGTKAARRDLQILRIVLPILRDDSRHTIEHFGKIDLRFGLTDHRSIDTVNGHRQIEAILRHACCADDELRDGLFGRGRWR